ncbi:MAG: hypothetical protein Q4E09_06510 [Eubacteriales bacterium]|nr:hypothetical protein [Eubacteriales bacterium]
MLDLANTLRALARLTRGLCLSFLFFAMAAQVLTGAGQNSDVSEQGAADLLLNQAEWQGEVNLSGSGAGKAQLPDWINWQNGKQSSADGNWSFKLEDRGLSLSSEGKLLGTTPADWQVQAALFADANDDGEDNLILLCWKQGKFGSYHPFG